MENQTTYDNTVSNASTVGWIKVPEYCTGDPSAAKVTHNHATGEFVFHDKDLSINLLLQAYRW